MSVPVVINEVNKGDMCWFRNRHKTNTIAEVIDVYIDKLHKNSCLSLIDHQVGM